MDYDGGKTMNDYDELGDYELSQYEDDD